MSEVYCNDETVLPQRVSGIQIELREVRLSESIVCNPGKFSSYIIWKISLFRCLSVPENITCRTFIA